MAKHLWPNTLPQSFSGDGDYIDRPEPTALRTRMEGVQTVVARKLASRAKKRVSGSMLMTSSQVDTFLDFYQNTTKGGVDSFTIPVHITAFSNSVLYWFANDPTISHVGGDTFRVAFTLLVAPT